MRPTAEEGRTLLRLARLAISDAVVGGDAVAAELARTEISPGLDQRCGIFVTLKSRESEKTEAGKLRGCIGCMTSPRPLYEAVIDVAPRAACGDPRFAPVSAAELDSIRISLSVLDPARPLSDPEKIRIGEDGVQLVSGARHAVFLPQVAAELGWDPPELLRQLAAKAGLPPDGWRKGELSSFRTHLLEEAGS